MGYRLEISKIKYYTCGEKLYGYCDDTSKLKSYKWLLNNGFLKGYEHRHQDWTFADCNENPHIVLSPKDFKKFIELYNEDFNNEYKEETTKDCIIKNKKIQELINDNDYILLEWF